MRLFVGGLNYKTTEEELIEHFEQIIVKNRLRDVVVTDAVIILDRETGRSKGFGFVDLQTRLDEDHMIDLLHHTELAGRDLTVNRANPKPERQTERTGGDGNGREHGNGKGHSKERNHARSNSRR